MASYIITLDQTQYASVEEAEAAIQHAGGLVEKTYQKVAYTFIVDAEDIGVLNSIPHLNNYELTDSMLVAYHAADTEFTMHHLTTMSSTGEHDPKFDGAGQTIYLLDTGVNGDHNEFAEATIVDLYKGTEMPNYLDDDGHGTGVASLIVGQNIGAAPSATLKNVKMFDGVEGTISVQEIIDALDAVLVDHAQTSGVKIACMPWVVSKNNLVDEKISELQDANIIVVAAAGNSGGDVNDFTPGGMDTIITVGAIDTESKLVASFNNLPRITYVDDETTGLVKVRNTAAQLDLFAVGVDVSVAWSEDPELYMYFTGTSPSAALASGMAAQFVQEFPEASAEEIKSYMATAAYLHAADADLDYGTQQVVDGVTVDYASINYGMAVSKQLHQNELTTLTSKRVVNVQNGQSATVTVGFLEGASNISVLDFSPLSPWMSFNLETGEFIADATNLEADRAPGVYNFAIRGDVNGETLVEELSVGVYKADSKELEESTEYYYDADTASYDEIISYETAGQKP
jgi:subtilisin family serine protease